MAHSRFMWSSRSSLPLAPASARGGMLKQIREAKSKGRIVRPERFCLLARHHGGSAGRRHVVRLRIADGVQAVVDVGANLERAAWNPANTGAPTECKAGAELESARVRMRAKIRDETESRFHLRNKVWPPRGSGDSIPGAKVGRVERSPRGPNLRSRADFQRIDEPPI